MTCFSAYTAFVGNEASEKVNTGTEIKTNDELAQIAEQTQNSYLMHHVITNQMYVGCYFREYFTVTKLAEEYQSTHKRLLDFYVFFYKGICEYMRLNLMSFVGCYTIFILTSEYV